MKTLTILILVAAVATGCCRAGASGFAGPDTPTSHAVDPGQPPATGGGASWVTSVPGKGPSNPVHPIAIRTGSSAGSGFAVVTWWGGVAPCYVLRSVRVAQHGTTIRIAVREGSGASAGTGCIEMAQLKRTRVDLGHLAPGRYTVIAGTVRSHLVIAG